MSILVREGDAGLDKGFRACHPWILRYLPPLYFITSSCRKGIHRSNKADNSLVCRPVAFFYAYLSQSWQVLEVEASEELVIYIILEESK
jgi:hypothetical protein